MEDRSAPGPVRTLALRCADWPVVALGDRGGEPVAVLAAERVVAADPAARALGVVPGLRRREAQARCPSIHLAERDESGEARAFEVVLEEMHQLAPRLEVREPGGCSLPTVGPSRYHGGDRALARLVVQQVRAALAAQLGDGRVPCAVGVGIVDGPRAAAIAALEDLGGHRAGQGATVVPSGATSAFLAPLPVELLGVEPPAGSTAADWDELTSLLRRLGLRTIGRVAQLGAPDISARFGALGVAAHRLATGAETEGPVLAEVPAELRVSAAVDPPAEQVERVAFLAKALADTLHVELAGRGLACTRVLVSAETELGERIERLWRHEGALSPGAIAQRTRWQLEGWLRTGRATSRERGGIVMLSLEPDQVIPDDGVQLGFWGDDGAARERAVRALAWVQALAGAEAVLVPEWQGGRSPGEQYRLVPLDTVDLTARGRSEDRPWPGRIPSPSPAVVEQRPRPVELVDRGGRGVGVGGRGLISASPVRCRIDGGTWVEVRAWAGPWCTDERWWDALAHRRRARVQVVLAPEGPDERGGEGPSSIGPTSPSPRHPSHGVAHLLTLEDSRWWLEATYD